MKYIINTTQRVYYSENEVTILLCRILSITIRKDAKSVSVSYNKERIYKQTFSEKEYELIKNSKYFLTLMEYVIPLKKYPNKIMDILKKNQDYLQTVFKNCL